MDVLLGLPGKIATLLDRLTATRATALDNLDAAISTRASAATAVSNATLTDARIQALDEISQGAVGRAPADITGIMDLSVDPPASPVAQYTPAAAPQSVFSAVGSGSLHQLHITDTPNSISRSLSIRITIDGVIIYAGQAPASSNVLVVDLLQFGVVLWHKSSILVELWWATGTPDAVATHRVSTSHMAY